MNYRVCRSETQLTSIHLMAPSTGRSANQQISKPDGQASIKSIAGERYRGMDVSRWSRSALLATREALVVSSASPGIGISSCSLFGSPTDLIRFYFCTLAVISTGLASTDVCTTLWCQWRGIRSEAKREERASLPREASARRFDPLRSWEI